MISRVSSVALAQQDHCPRCSHSHVPLNHLSHFQAEQLTCWHLSRPDIRLIGNGPVVVRPWTRAFDLWKRCRTPAVTISSANEHFSLQGVLLAS